MTTVVYWAVFVFSLAITATNGSPKGLGVVGGVVAFVKDYPYQAELQLSGKHHCGGSIISEDYILTAAHCVKYFPLHKIQVRVGSSYVGKGGQLYNISEAYVHHQYNHTIYDYDVAVLKLNKTMQIDGITTKVVKLANPGSRLVPGNEVKISGWGKIREGGPYPKSLRAAMLPVLPRPKCKAAFVGTGSKFTDRMFCAGLPEGGKDACNGDSGGPAVHAKTLIQYGIMSWGRGCGRTKFPGVYTYIPIVRNWITCVSGV